MWYSHGCHCEECRLLDCYAMYLRESPTFRRNITSVFGSRSKPLKKQADSKPGLVTDSEDRGETSDCLGTTWLYSLEERTFSNKMCTIQIVSNISLVTMAVALWSKVRRSSTGRTLGSWVRILVVAWVYIRVVSVFMLAFVYSIHSLQWNTPNPKDSYIISKGVIVSGDNLNCNRL
jgi:hypothetical protein